MSKKDRLSTEPYKGVRDFYPEDQAFLNYIIATQRQVVERFGYAEYSASILEPSELYKNKGAENEEIVNEQTYTFTDRGDREVTLRPEMTPTVARLVAGKRRELGFPLRWYSIPNLFRYERPQRGRLREHWQLNVDIFGSNAAEADAEVIAVASAVMKAFGATDSDFVIKVASRKFLDTLTKDLGLSEATAKKLRGILDRKDKVTKEQFEADLTEIGVALEITSPNNPPEDVKEILRLLKAMGVTNAVFEPSIVRGFDYYTGIVFEVFDTHPENNRALLGGGRYDNLLELFDDSTIPGVGFGMGDATIRDFLTVRNMLPDYAPATKVYVAVAGTEFVPAALELADGLRKEGVATAVDFGEKKLGDQIKTADKQRVPYVIVIGSDEASSGNYKVKDLATGEEKRLSRTELASFFLNL
ncbi:MAG: histidine--tRNA ligase [Candidatus Pacebacteria bacterium]|nr:histidine--tRNA ligase [Candidatus Paceibacterota bacterium]